MHNLNRHFWRVGRMLNISDENSRRIKMRRPMRKFVYVLAILLGAAFFTAECRAELLTQVIITHKLEVMALETNLKSEDSVSKETVFPLERFLDPRIKDEELFEPGLLKKLVNHYDLFVCPALRDISCSGQDRFSWLKFIQIQPEAFTPFKEQPYGWTRLEAKPDYNFFERCLQAYREKVAPLVKEGKLDPGVKVIFTDRLPKPPVIILDNLPPMVYQDGNPIQVFVVIRKDQRIE